MSDTGETFQGGCISISLETCLEHQHGIVAIATLPNGWLASVGIDNIIMIWDTNPPTSTRIGVLEGHKGHLCVLAALPDGRLLSGGYDKRINIWDLNEMRLQVSFGQDGLVTCLTAFANGRWFASGCYRKVNVWDAADNSLEASLEGHVSTITALTEIPHKNALASSSDDGTIILWNTGRGSCTCFAKLRQVGGSVLAMVAMNDGRLVSAGSDTTINVWDIDTKECLKVMSGHEHSIFSLARMVDDNILISCDGAVKLWDLDQDRDPEQDCCIATLKGHMSQSTSVVHGHTDGRIATGGTDCPLKLWHVEKLGLVFK